MAELGRRAGVLLVLVLGLLLPSVTTAAVSAEARCKIMKLKAVLKEAKDKAHCYERSLKANLPSSQICFARAEERRQRYFQRVEETGGCATVKDGASLGVRVDGFLQDVTTALQGRASPRSTSGPKATSAPEATPTPVAGPSPTPTSMAVPPPPVATAPTAKKAADAD